MRHVTETAAVTHKMSATESLRFKKEGLGEEGK